VGDLRDGAYLGAKTVLETDVCERHNACIAVYHLFVIDSRKAVAFGTHKLHLGPSNTLREPNMTHRGKLELTHYDFLPFLEIQRACDAIDARRGAGHDGDFIRASIYELRKGGSRFLIPVHPRLPWRALLVPTRNVVRQARLHGI
jgi:hypothetical protein